MALNHRIGHLGPKPDSLGPSPAAFAVGSALVGLAVSGFLDDSGVVSHPWWSVPAAGLLLASLAIAGRTLWRLWSDPEPPEAPPSS